MVQIGDKVAVSLAESLTEATYDRVMDWARKHRVGPMLRTLLEIWQADDPKKLMRYDRMNRLMPLLERMKQNLQTAQMMRAEPANLHLPDYEILQMAEVPLRLPPLEASN